MQPPQPATAALPARVMDHVVVARRVPSTRYAQSAGAKIAFQVSGEGPCDLVFVPGLVAPSLAGPASRDAAEAFERAAASPGMAAALIESMGQGNVSGLLATLQVPALVVHREQDIIPLADARAVADAIRGAVLKVVPGGDHLPWAGDWEPVVQAVVGFIDDIAGPVTAPAKEPRASPPGLATLDGRR